MTKRVSYNFSGLFSPLDAVTILYMLLSGIYLCFVSAPFTEILSHLTIRTAILLLVVGLALLNQKFRSDKFLLFVRNLYPLLFVGFFYTETSFVKNVIFPENLDGYFFNAEQSLWNCQPSQEFSKFMNQDWFNEMMNLFYFSYYIIIGATCITLYIVKSDQSKKEIFIVVFSFYLYYIIFAILPVVGPQYYIPGTGPETTPPYFFGKLMHHILTNLEQPTGAFPSSHVGIAAIIGWVACKHLKKLFFMMLPFILGICFATVYIKAHYLIDVIAGLISAPIFIILSGKIYNKFLPCGLQKHDQKNNSQGI